jgi:hypothetical protein
MNKYETKWHISRYLWEICEKLSQVLAFKNSKSSSWHLIIARCRDQVGQSPLGRIFWETLQKNRKICHENCHLGVGKSTSLPTKWGPLLDSKVDHLHMFHGWNTYNFYPEKHGLNLNNSTCTIHGANAYKRGSNTP